MRLQASLIATKYRMMSRFIRSDGINAKGAGVPAWLPILILLLLLSTVLELTRDMNRIDRLISDQLLKLADYQIDNRIVLITVDERSLVKLGRWPWRRTLHAELLLQLSKADVAGVAFDILFSEPSEVSDDDSQFAAALRQQRSVVLAAFADTSSARQRMVVPIPVLVAAAAGLGHAHVEIDQDGVVRSAFLKEKFGSIVWSGLSLSLLEAVNGPAERVIATSRPSSDGQRHLVPIDGRYAKSSDRLGIPFARVNHAPTKLSFVDVIEGRVPVERLRGKLVLVGLDSAGLGDAYPTPVTGNGALMSGVEIHANILSALLGGDGFREGKNYENLLLSFCVVGLSVICLIKVRARLVPVTLAIMAFAVIIVIVILQCQFGVQMAPSVAFLVLVLVYPAWTWQRLSAAVEYLSEETRRIHENDGFVIGPICAADSDDLGRNIASLRSGIHALRHLRSLVEASLNAIPDAVFVSNQDGVVVLANKVGERASRLAGILLVRHSVLLNVLRAICPGIHQFQSIEYLASKCMEDDASDIELKSFDGRSLLIKFSKWQFLDNPGGWVVSLLDITSIRKAERERDDALKFIAHDIRAPQASIIALLELRRLRGADEAVDRTFQKIEFHARRTLALADEFARLDQAESACITDIAGGEVDLWEVLDMAAENVRELAAARGMQICILRPEEEELTVRGNFSMLVRAIANLMENSIKYGYERSRVLCEISFEDCWLVVSVSDRGRGLSREDQGRIFEKFVRIQGEHNSQLPGIGLGLAYVRAVAEKHGGRVRLESALGFGSRFEILLPVAQARLD